MFPEEGEQRKVQTIIFVNYYTNTVLHKCRNN